MKPDKASAEIDKYVNELSRRIAMAMTGWLSEDHSRSVATTPALEETEAWLLPLWDWEDADPSTRADLKARLHFVLRSDRSGLSENDRRQIAQLNERERAAFLSRGLRKRAIVVDSGCAERASVCEVAGFQSPDDASAVEENLASLRRSRSTRRS